MKFFSKSIFIVLLLSGANSLSVGKEFISLEREEKRNKKPGDYFVEERALSKPTRQEEEQQARGLVLRFHRWPTLKEQEEVARILEASGLKRTKNIKSFNAQLFGWEEGELKPSSLEGELKPSSLGEEVCLDLKSKNLSYLKRCSPDTQLSVNSIKKITNKKTEAGFNPECENCKNQEFESLTAVSQKSVDIKTCNIVSSKLGLMEGKLSDYWVQELIGSDLLREELEKTPPPDIENWISVFDSKEKGHNIGVKNLISDEDLHAVLPELGERKVPFLDVSSQSDRDYKKAKRYKSALSMYETNYPGDYLFDFKNRSPHYINNSMPWDKSEDIYDVFKELSTSGVTRSIVVTTSGNEFPERLGDIKSKASKDYDLIVVGSFSPKGFVSSFSQSGEELSILAPSDDWITSAGKNGEYKLFGGTSGAAPLVTGSLAGFEWLSGYHPTAKEAKILLEKTALPTLHSFEQPPINGAGLLNAYKLGEVAKRLKKKCGESISCFRKEILNDKNYHFPEDKSLKKDVARFFPFCSSGGESGAFSNLSSCEEKEKLFKRLRKALLLRPSEDLLKSLSCIYKAGGFEQNAEALDKLAMALGTEEELRSKLKESLANKPVSDEILRLALGMGGFEEELDSSELRRGIKIAGGLGENGLPLLEKVFESGDFELQVKALYAAEEIGGKGLLLLEEAFESGDRELKKDALYLARELGEKGLSLLNEGYASGDPELQRVALHSAGSIGEKGLPLLEKSFKSGVWGLQAQALYSARELGEKGLPLLEKGFKHDDRILQKLALDSAKSIGKKSLPLLRKVLKNQTNLDKVIKEEIRAYLTN